MARYALIAWVIRVLTLARKKPYLPKTYLDGAALLLPDGTPVIGLTLRHDRIEISGFTCCMNLPMFPSTSRHWNKL
jgi:hypothetical protein